MSAEGGRVKADDFGVWSTSAREALDLRLKALHDGLVELLQTHEVDAVAMEESYVGADARTSLTVGQARGALLIACASAGVPTSQYPPATIKQTVGGWGRADKKQMQRMVATILGLAAPPTPHHAADALAVAICHAMGSPLLAATGAGR